MTDQNQPYEGNQPSAGHEWNPVPDPSAQDWQAEPQADTEPVAAEPSAEPPFDQPADPYAQPSAPQYGQSPDPYAQPSTPQYGQSPDPYAQPSAPQYGQQADPFAQQAGGYGQQGQGYTPPGIQPGFGGAPAGFGPQMNPAYNAPPNEAAANTLTLNYWLSVFFSWIPALIFFLIEKDKNALVDDHLKENMNFQITRVIAGLVTAVPVIGWIVGGIASLVLFVFAIIGALKAPDEYRAGRQYRFPFALRILK